MACDVCRSAATNATAYDNWERPSTNMRQPISPSLTIANNIHNHIQRQGSLASTHQRTTSWGESPRHVQTNTTSPICPRTPHQQLPPVWPVDSVSLTHHRPTPPMQTPSRPPPPPYHMPAMQSPTSSGSRQSQSELLGTREMLNRVLGHCMPCLIVGHPLDRARHSPFECPNRSLDTNLHKQMLEVSCAKFSCCFTCRLPLYYCPIRRGEFGLKQCEWPDLVLPAIVAALNEPAWRQDLSQMRACPQVYGPGEGVEAIKFLNRKTKWHNEEVSEAFVFFHKILTMVISWQT